MHLLRTIAVVLCLLLPLVTGAEPWKVRVRTTDGNLVSGVMDLERFHVDTDAGGVDLEVGDVREIEFTAVGQEFRKQDDSLVKGRVARASWALTTEKLGVVEIKTTAVKTIQMLGRVNAEGAKPETGDPATDPPRYAKPQVEVLFEARLGGCLVPGGGRSADGSSFWVVDASANKVKRFTFDSLKLAGEMACAEPVQKWSVAPSGRRAVAIAAGKLMIVDLDKETATDRLDTGEVLKDAVLMDDDTVVVAAVSGAATAWSLSGRQKSRAIPGSGGLLTRTEGGLDVLCGGGYFHVTPGSSGGAPAVDWHPRWMHEGIYSRDLSLGSQFIANTSGSVRLLARGHLAMNREYTKTEPITAVLALAGGHRAILFHRAKATVIALDPFKIVSEITLGVTVHEAIADAAGKTMAIFSTAPDSPRIEPMRTPKGDIFLVRIPE